MRIVIATVKVPFVRGGAEILAEGLQEALRADGHEAEIVALPFKWYPPESILDHMLACRLLDLTNSSGTPIDLLIGLKFPAYYIPHPRKVLWLLHQHRQAYDLWEHPEAGDMKYYPRGVQVRSAIQEADQHLLCDAKAIFTLSRNVSQRLKNFSGIDSTPLYHPPMNAEAFHCGDAGDYLFLPSRISALKRQELVVRALACTREPVRMCFAGLPDSADSLGALKKLTSTLKLDQRVEWLDGITEEKKIELYANCLGVVYPPVDEDYGYVTLEGMLSSKPVITCTDSGGPKEFIIPARTGSITEPEPAALAEAMDTLWEDRKAAARMGEAGRKRYESLNISWRNVVRKLLA